MRSFIEMLRQPLADLPDPLPLQPLPGAFKASIRPPGSKSLTNRALVLAGLARGASFLKDPLLDAEDAEVMVEALRRFGADLHMVSDSEEGDLLRIDGVGGRPSGAGELHLANAGTAVRFLTAVAGLASGETIIDGSERMRQRPIGGLAATLRAMRVRVDFLGEYGFPPIRILPAEGGGKLAGGSLRLPAQASSQFLSALLMVAPWTLEGISLNLAEEPISRPYLRMTLTLLQRLGASNISAFDDLTSMVVAPGPLQAFDLTIEPDASGATYLWAAAAISPGSSCDVEGITTDSIQGDAHFATLLGRAGAHVTLHDDSTTVAAPPDGHLFAVSEDLSDMPDSAMTLAAVACFADGETKIGGLSTLPLKECNRLAATVAELSKLEIEIHATGDSLSITPTVPVDQSELPVTFDTYNDHRMAMSLALIGLRRPNVFIAKPACVAKTYPTFWRDLSKLYESAYSQS